MTKEKEEQIEKLVRSNNFNDVYIGFSIFNKLERREQLRFLKKYFTKPQRLGYCSWLLDSDIDIKDGPREYEDGYIKGKFYSVIIQRSQIMIDSPCVFKRFSSVKNSNWPVVEDWSEL